MRVVLSKARSPVVQIKAFCSALRRICAERICELRALRFALRCVVRSDTGSKKDRHSLGVPIFLVTRGRIELPFQP